MKKCIFCGKIHKDWEKECKYWGRPPVKVKFMKTLKFAKPKKVSISKLKKKAWDAFSLYVRTKYANPMGGVVCYTCGRLFTIKTTQAGHGIAGRNNAVLFCEPLVRPQCVGCNFFGGGKYAIFMNKLIKEYGAEKFSQLVMMSTMTVQRKAQDYIDIYEEYKKKLSEIGEV